MKAFTRLDGRAAPLELANIDTDQIIPKQFLKTVEREGLAKGLFYDFRFDADGNEIKEFVLNKPEYKGASVLIAGDNFGCGSSREHAPWALMDFGIKCVISTSFADIFYNNCFQNGLLPVVLDEAIVDELLAQPGIELAIDIATRTVALPDGRRFEFPLDAFAQTCLLEGVDQLGYLLTQQPAIQRFEAARDAAGAA